MFTTAYGAHHLDAEAGADCVGKIGLVPGEAPVSTLDSRIHATFVTRLQESILVDGATARTLSDMLSRDKPPNPEVLLKTYAASDEGVGA